MSPKSAAAKKAAKIVSDKTFGMKNKNKSKKVQEYVAGVKAAAKNAGRPRSDVVADEARRRQREAEKKAKEMQDMEMSALFKTVVTQQTVVPAGVDPRTVVCAYFKAGKCVRGQKCKFSHNVEQERKTAKMSLYVDPREQEKDTMDKWDQAKLEAVVESKYKKPQNETKIVCKHFLDAIEKLKYGWFWECPTDKRAREECLPVGCIYKHALPPGFVFQPKVDKKIEDLQEEDDALTLMEQIEEERKALDLSKCTPVTLDSFMKWKADKKKKKEQETEQKRKEEAKKTGTKGLGILSGRDLFKYDPSLFVDDADAVDDAEYKIEDNNETQEEMQKRLEAEAAAEDEEMKRRAQFEARAELYRNDATADATTAVGTVADAEVGGTTTAIAFALPASLMGKAKPTNVGDASLFDDDEVVDDDDDAAADADGDADADADAGEGEAAADGEGEATADGGEGEAAADAGEGEADAAATDDADADADAGAGDADADADTAAADADADAAAAADESDAKDQKSSDAKSAPAPAAAASSKAAATAAATAAAAPKPATAVVGDASLFDEDLDDLPDT